MFRFFPHVGCLVFLLGGTRAAEPEVDPAEMPRVPPRSPAEALAEFEVRPGFRLEIVAHEPEIVDPIAIAFDESGGIYAVEMRGYSERREEALGRIRYLRDEDGDGRFEKSVVFKDGLKWPTTVLPYKGGVFVGASPDIFYFKDIDGDHICDQSEVVFTGFGEGPPRLNMQALFNSLRWGPDNRIWGSTAGNGGMVRRAGRDSDPDSGNNPPVSVRGSDFSFDPEKRDFRLENGTVQFGLSFDSFGRRFLTGNSRHAVWVAWERGDLRRNPLYDPPAPLVDINNDGPAPPIFRISPDEPWRIVRTRWRVSGVVRGLVEGGGRVSGYFTAASSAHIHWADAYGGEYYDNLFVGDVGSNLVHRKRLLRIDGKTAPVAARAEEEEGTEFLRSPDNWFRPVSMATGPDGCLHICDMYRETIEHPWSLPPGIKRHLDLNSGNDRGRIYRVVPEGFQRPNVPDLGQADDPRLRELAQDSRSDWHQTTARRLLFERGRPMDPKPRPSPFPALLQAGEPLLDRLTTWAGDPWLEAVILNSLRSKADLAAAWNHPDLDRSPGIGIGLARMTGRLGDPEVTRSLIRSLEARGLDPHTLNLLRSLKEGMGNRATDWDEVAGSPALAILLESGRTSAADPALAEPGRIVAVQLLHLVDPGSDSSLLRKIITDPRSPPGLVSTALPGISDPLFLLDQFDRLPPVARGIAAAKLMRDTEGAEGILLGIRDQRLAMDSIPADTIRQLREFPDPKVRELAAEILPELVSRADILKQYQKALALPGDPTNGKAVFQKACMACHQSPDGEGFALGPPVSSFQAAGKESLLGNILNPNQLILPEHRGFEFTLKNGETATGIIESENLTEITLAQSGGIKKQFPRKSVTKMTGLKKSLMPEGLEDTITIQEMADLLAFLVQ